MLTDATLAAAAERLFENPLDPGLQEDFERATRAHRDAQLAGGHPEPLGTTYPRTSRDEFSRSEIIAALAFGIQKFGRDSIDWARLTTDAFRPAGGGVPGWAAQTQGSVCAGTAPAVEAWRRANVCDRQDGYVKRFDTNLAVPIMSWSRRGQSVAHPKIVGVAVQIDDNGFPVFAANIEVAMPYSLFSRSDKAQFAFCNREVASRAGRDTTFSNALHPSLRAAYRARIVGGAPPGWVWHHHQDAGRMQLVRKTEHDAVCIGQVKHTGGAAIWCADHRHRPRDALTGKERRHVFKTLLTVRPRDRKQAR